MDAAALRAEITSALDAVKDWAHFPNPDLEAKGATAFKGRHGEWGFLVVKLDGKVVDGTASGPKCAMFLFTPDMKARAQQVPLFTDAELAALTAQCDRCRLRDLEPIGAGKERFLAGQRLWLCDRCWTDVGGLDA